MHATTWVMRRTLLVRILGGIALCMSSGAGMSATAIPPADNIDLPRFMGDWYVIAHIPSLIERDDYAAIESYALRTDGRIQTTYRFRNGSFDAPEKALHPLGTVRPGTGNAVWAMQVLWPIKAEYVITWVSDDYSQTVIGRSKRDYAWIMARTPTISDADYEVTVMRLQQLGYSLDKLRKVPQVRLDEVPRADH